MRTGDTAALTGWRLPLRAADGLNDYLGLGPDLFEAASLREPPDVAEVAVAPRRVVRGRSGVGDTVHERHRQPNVGPRAADPQIDPGESIGRHADDDDVLIGDTDGTAENGGIGPELADPESVRDDSDPRAIEVRFLGCEGPSNRGRGAEHVEIVRAHQRCGEWLRVWERRGDGRGGARRDPLQTRRRLAKRQVVVVPRIDGDAAGVRMEALFDLDLDELALVADAGERPEGDAVGERHSGDHRRDAKAETANDRKRVVRRFHERADAVAHVLRQGIEPRARADVAHPLFNLLNTPELRERGASRLFKAVAGTDPGVDVLAQVGQDLVVQRTVNLFPGGEPARQRLQPRPPSAHAPSSTRPTATVIAFQCCSSFASCFLPAFVMA